MGRYARESERIMEILGRFTDLVEPVSIDEAFLDVTGSARALGTGEAIARKLKQAICDETGLTASVGVAASKLVAKIASDLQKPDGLTVVPPGTETAFLAPLAVRRLWGVGPKMEETLAKLGVRTIGDLQALDPARLERRVGTHGHDLQQLARGEDERELPREPEGARSVGHEHTFGEDTADRERLRAVLLQLADSVAARLRAHGLRARTVTLKYRDEDFRTTTHARTLKRPTDSGGELFRVASELFAEVHGRKRVRLVGISTSHFGEATAQLGLFDAKPEPAKLDRLRDELARRFGDESVTRASLLGRKLRRNPSDKPPR
jgi:DNA polymerase-4